MARLPTSLSIALWIVGSIWLLAVLAWTFDVSVEYVWAALVFGVFAGVAEWIVREKQR
jgi:hypothetical protein